MAFEKDEKAIEDCEDDERKKALTENLAAVKNELNIALQHDLNRGFENFQGAITTASDALIRNFKEYFSSAKVLKEKRDAMFRARALEKSQKLYTSDGTAGAGAGSSSTRGGRGRKARSGSGRATP